MVKLSDETKAVLKNFANINPSIEIGAGNVIKTINHSTSVFAKSQIKENFPRDFAIYDLMQFNSILNMFDSPELTFGEHSVIISEGQNSVNFVYADPRTLKMMKSAKEINFNLPESVVSFSISKEQLKEIINFSQILRLDEIVISGDGNVLTISSVQAGNDTTNSFKKNIGTTNQSFSVIVRKENLEKVALSDYTVNIAGNRAVQLVDQLNEYILGVESDNE